MTFEEAEAKFKDLQARVQRGEPLSRAEYEAQVSQLGVHDERGTLWEINPRTGKWMQFDGAEWVPGRPPGRDQSTVMPLAQLANPPSAVTPRQSAAPTELMRPMPPAPRPTANAPTARVNAPEARATANNPEAAAPTPYRIASDEKPARPERTARLRGDSAGGEPPAGSRGNIFAGRPWLPFAIGAVVLLVCAIVLLVGGNVLMSAVSPTRTPTRAALPPAPATVIRIPTNTPIPPTPVPVLGKITTTTANVRAAPNTRGKIVTTLKKNNQVTLVAQTTGQAIAGKDVWYQINIAGQPEPGWIFSDNVQIDQGDPKTLPVIAGTPTPTPKGAAPALPVTPTPLGGGLGATATPTKKP